MLTALRQGRGDIPDRSENSAGRLGRLKPSRLESGGQFPPWDAWDGGNKLFYISDDFMTIRKGRKHPSQASQLLLRRKSWDGWDA